MKTKPFVGQILYSLNVGNTARMSPQVLTPVVVKKIGRKYFTAGRQGSWIETEFRLDDWTEKTDYSADQMLYASEQEWLDEKEASEIIDRIKKAFNRFSNPRLSLETLRKINALIP